MSLLKVGHAGLQTLAIDCHGWSSDVAGTGAPSAPSASAQATAAAVGAVHAGTGVVGGVLSTRMTSNGGQLSATAQELSAQDQAGAQELRGVHEKSAADAILGAMAGGPAGGDEKPLVGASAGLPGSLLPDKTDWILGGAGATAQTITDKVAGLTRSSLANGGNGASSTLAKAVSEIKNPLAAIAKAAPALGSKMGGGVGAVMSIPAVARDVGEGKMSAGQAIAREGVGLVAGTMAAAPVAAVPVVGPPMAVGAGIVASNMAAKGVDVVWEPLQEFGEAAAEGGYKVGRLGRP